MQALRQTHNHSTLTKQPLTEQSSRRGPVGSLEPVIVVQRIPWIKGVVNHTYRDYSSVPPPSADYFQHIPCTLDALTFSQKLHLLLDSAKCADDCLAWMPHGRAFCIPKPAVFAQTVCPAFLGADGRSSRIFVRQLEQHGFKRLSQGVDRNCYYHELMLRGRFYLAQHVLPRRRRHGDARCQRQAADPAHEPDFYHISTLHPLIMLKEEEQEEQQQGETIVAGETQEENEEETLAVPGSQLKMSDSMSREHDNYSSSSDETTTSAPLQEISFRHHSREQQQQPFINGCLTATIYPGVSPLSLTRHTNFHVVQRLQSVMTAGKILSLEQQASRSISSLSSGSSSSSLASVPSSCWSWTTSDSSSSSAGSSSSSNSTNSDDDDDDGGGGGGGNMPGNYVSENIFSGDPPTMTAVSGTTAMLQWLLLAHCAEMCQKIAFAGPNGVPNSPPITAAPSPLSSSASIATSTSVCAASPTDVSSIYSSRKSDNNCNNNNNNIDESTARTILLLYHFIQRYNNRGGIC